MIKVDQCVPVIFIRKFNKSCHDGNNKVGREMLVCLLTETVDIS
jgi:hypothetical protein